MLWAHLPSLELVRRPQHALPVRFVMFTGVTAEQRQRRVAQTADCNSSGAAGQVIGQQIFAVQRAGTVAVGTLSMIREVVVGVVEFEVTLERGERYEAKVECNAAACRRVLPMRSQKTARVCRHRCTGVQQSLCTGLLARARVIFSDVACAVPYALAPRCGTRLGR